MTRKEIKVNDNRYTFINETYSNYSAWGHKTNVFLNDSTYPIASNKVRYYNRTWECYEYQTCMIGAIHILINNISNRLIYEYKEENNIKRLAQSKKDEIIANNDQIKELNKVIEALRTR